jgi:hypothetical protein
MLIFTNIFAAKVLLKTEYDGEISINSQTIKFAQRQIEFGDILILTLKPYISRSRYSYIPQWKLCDELQIKLKDNSEYRFLISKNYPPLTIPIFSFLEKMKQMNGECNEKIKLPNRTGFFSTEAIKHST